MKNLGLITTLILTNTLFTACSGSDSSKCISAADSSTAISSNGTSGGKDYGCSKNPFGNPVVNPNEQINQTSGMEVVPIAVDENGNEIYEFFTFNDIPSRDILCRYAYSPFDNNGQGEFVVSRRFNELKFYLEDSTNQGIFFPIHLKINESEDSEILLESLPVISETQHTLYAGDHREYMQGNSEHVVETYNFEVFFNDDEESTGDLERVKSIHGRNQNDETNYVTYLRHCRRI